MVLFTGSTNQKMNLSVLKRLFKKAIEVATFEWFLTHVFSSKLICLEQGGCDSERKGGS